MLFFGFPYLVSCFCLLPSKVNCIIYLFIVLVVNSVFLVFVNVVYILANVIIDFNGAV